MKDSLETLFDGLSVALISDAATKLSLPDSVLGSGVRAVVGARVIGRALTLDRVKKPANVTQEKIAPELKSGLYDLVDSSTPGAVLVIATGGDAEVALWGGNMANRAKAAGAAGLVTDGAVRDIAETREIGLTVFAQAVTPRGGGFRHYVTLSRGRPVICGGVYIRPGDIIFGDEDGVIAIEPENLDVLLAEARRLLAGEVKAQSAVKAGHGLAESNAAHRG